MEALARILKHILRRFIVLAAVASLSALPVLPSSVYGQTVPRLPPPAPPAQPSLPPPSQPAPSQPGSPPAAPTPTPPFLPAPVIVVTPIPVPATPVGGSPTGAPAVAPAPAPQPTPVGLVPLTEDAARVSFVSVGGELIDVFVPLELLQRLLGTGGSGRPQLAFTPGVIVAPSAAPPGASLGPAISLQITDPGVDPDQIGILTSTVDIVVSIIGSSGIQGSRVGWLRPTYRADGSIDGFTRPHVILDVDRGTLTIRLPAADLLHGVVLVPATYSTAEPPRSLAQQVTPALVIDNPPAPSFNWIDPTGKPTVPF